MFDRIEKEFVFVVPATLCYCNCSKSKRFNNNNFRSSEVKYMRYSFCCVTIVMLIALAGCSGKVEPIIDYDPAANFSLYKTWSFISENPMLREEGAGGGSPLTQGRVMNTIEDNLAMKGFTRIGDPEAADITISFTVGARDKIRVNNYPETYRGGYGAWGRGWGGSYYSHTRSVNIGSQTQGILSIDIYDVRSHSPVWHGQAKKGITQSMMRDPGPVIDEIVNAVMDGFPPN
jgi:hypothetical protein